MLHKGYVDSLGEQEPLASHNIPPLVMRVKIIYMILNMTSILFMV